MENKKVLFTDLDGTLIDTISGEAHPKGVWDVKIKFDVWDKIKKVFPNVEYILIATNQGGIETGKLDAQHFTSKIMWILDSMQEYFGDAITINGTCCPSHDENNKFRKPNTGMLSKLLTDLSIENMERSSMIMLGDASGKEGDFSDSDKKVAENFGIDYIDVEDFLNK